MASQAGGTCEPGRGVSWEVTPRPLHSTGRPRKVGASAAGAEVWAGSETSFCPALCQQGPGALQPPPLPATLALRPTPVCLGPLPPGCSHSGVSSADHGQQDKAAFVGPSALGSYGVPSSPSLPVSLWLPPPAPVWVGGSQRALQVGSDGPDGVLGGEALQRLCATLTPGPGC